MELAYCTVTSNILRDTGLVDTIILGIVLGKNPLEADEAEYEVE